jgi:hypothetical protein
MQALQDPAFPLLFQVLSVFARHTSPTTLSPLEDILTPFVASGCLDRVLGACVPAAAATGAAGGGAGGGRRARATVPAAPPDPGLVSAVLACVCNLLPHEPVFVAAQPQFVGAFAACSRLVLPLEAPWLEAASAATVGAGAGAGAGPGAGAAASVAGVEAGVAAAGRRYCSALHLQRLCVHTLAALLVRFEVQGALPALLTALVPPAVQAVPGGGGGGSSGGGGGGGGGGASAGARTGADEGAGVDAGAGPGAASSSGPGCRGSGGGGSSSAGRGGGGSRGGSDVGGSTDAAALPTLAAALRHHCLTACDMLHRVPALGLPPAALGSAGPLARSVLDAWGALLALVRDLVLLLSVLTASALEHSGGGAARDALLAAVEGPLACVGARVGPGGPLSHLLPDLRLHAAFLQSVRG